MRVKIYYLVLVISFLSFTSTNAQEKKAEQMWKKSSTVKEFKSAMKDKKYADAKTAIDKAIGKHEDAKADAQLYSMKTAALMELISAENRKIYLNQRPDTTQYFSLILDLYQTGLLCDSIEQATIAKNTKTKEKYRQDVSSRMITYRSKLVTAGKFFYTKKNYSTAFQYFEMYLRTKNAPVFSDKAAIDVINKEKDNVEISALATLSAFGSNNHTGVMTYLTESLKDKALESKLLEIGSRSAAELGDSVEMVNLLENGFYNYPSSDYFFLTLTKYYNSHNLYEKALAKATRMTELYPDKRDYLFIRGKEEMLMQELDKALISFGKCITLKPDDAESFSSLGNIYLQKARNLYAQLNRKSANQSAKSKQEIAALYGKACENFENAKKFKEEETSLWLDGLREAYFKLNKGKELKALDKYK